MRNANFSNLLHVKAFYVYNTLQVRDFDIYNALHVKVLNIHNICLHVRTLVGMDNMIMDLVRRR
jgi:hypothetical protein